MSEEKKPVSAYQQLSGILNALKSEEMSLNDALNKIQYDYSISHTLIRKFLKRKD
jgi:exonuclease VII small subunit